MGPDPNDTIRLKRRGDSGSIEIRLPDRTVDLTSLWSDQALAIVVLKQWRDLAVRDAVERAVAEVLEAQERAAVLDLKPNGSGHLTATGKRLDAEGYGH